MNEINDHSSGTYNREADVADTNNGDKKVIIKNYAPFIDCISEINNTHVDNAKGIDVVVIVIYSLIEYSDNCSKTLRRL